MPSHSHVTWTTHSRRTLDQIEQGHVRVSGSVGPGRRYAALWVNYAYTMSLSSLFQQYCRELHTECVDVLISRVEIPGVAPAALRDMLSEQIVLNRRLDQGNPNPSSLGSDFRRFGIDLWAEIRARSPRKCAVNRRLLDELNLWRNAIAHQDFRQRTLDGKPYPFPAYLQLNLVRRWRRTCEDIAGDLDVILEQRMRMLIGRAPW